MVAILREEGRLARVRKLVGGLAIEGRHAHERSLLGHGDVLVDHVGQAAEAEPGDRASWEPDVLPADQRARCGGNRPGRAYVAKKGPVDVDVRLALDPHDAEARSA